MSVIYSSVRRFECWAYTVSHQKLLLRSPKNDTHSTRVDVLFSEIEAHLIFPVFPALSILQSGNLGRFPVQLPATNLTFQPFLFELQSARVTGYIVARSIQFMEDDGEYHEPDAWGVLPSKG
ncbi:hypothetical protein [Mesorhizobium sp. CN2-181]|uniref:hypothetical protein n=1 Tax=Mesorhizobium yinganensis TaxID=3157707 RepID=UPI0032B7EB90